MTIQEFIEQVCDITVDMGVVEQAIYPYGLAIFDKITITTPGGVVLIGEDDEH